jgi:hypothetical protein
MLERPLVFSTQGQLANRFAATARNGLFGTAHLSARDYARGDKSTQKRRKKKREKRQHLLAGRLNSPESVGQLS